MTRVLLGVAFFTLAVAVARRLGHARDASVPGVELALETVVLTGAVLLAALGVLASVLAALGWFGPGTMAIGAVVMAAIVWARTPAGRARGRLRVDARHVIPIAIVLVGGALLRWPPMDAPLAGRDHGTYTLRASHTLRTGGLGFQGDTRDPVLAAAGEALGTRPGPADLLGLYAARDEAWRRDRYEAAYRPGFYLADRERGVVVPQFLHLHPCLLATAGLVVGVPGMHALVVIEGVLSILALYAIARRTFPGEVWACVVAGLFAGAPVAIWVHRTALSEAVTGLFVGAAVLAALRAREDAGELEVCAGVVGAIAWTRGNGYLAAPIVLGCLWLVPRATERRLGPVSLYFVLLVGSVIVHAFTAFPYLHDELARQLGGIVEPSPWVFVIAIVMVAIGWFVIDAVVIGRIGDQKVGRIARALPFVWAGVAVCGVVLYAVLRGTSPEGAWSRLDPAGSAIGLPMLIFAAIGVVVAARRFVPERAADAWLLAIAGTVASTIVLYAPRNLPQLGLYYYGRYLVPELLPAACLLSVVAVHAGYRWLAVARPRLAVGSSATAIASMAIATSGVLVRHPVTWIDEFAGARAQIDAIAHLLEPEAIVIAGGEGWHHGHTWNQVGGALHVGHGRRVLPYRTREAAYASLYELLIGGPEARGTPPPPVYLLLNEATHHYRREPEHVPVAAIDDALPPPFVGRRVATFELFLHRLTPTEDVIPTRVTRDELRMALVRVEVDPERRGEVRLPIASLAPRGGAGPRAGVWCLSKDRPLVALLPEHDGPRQLVLVAAAGTGTTTATWRIEADGRTLDPWPPHMPPREAETLGPFVLERSPRTISIRAGQARVEGAACERGGLAEIRLLELDRPAVTDGARALSFAPPRDLGHAIEPSRWVSGRGLSRYRAGIEPKPSIRGVSMVLTPEAALTFPPAVLPGRPGEPLDLVVTLTRTRLHPDARLVLAEGDREIAVIDPPDDRSRSWQSVPLSWTPARALARFTLRLVHARPDDVVHVRDIGVFARSPVAKGRLVHAR